MSGAETSEKNVCLELAPRYLLKHLAAVHNSASFTLVQRKICNVFLENASHDLECEEHSLSVKEVMDAIGWTEDSNVNESFKENLRGLTRVQVEWNVLEKDRKNKWVTSTFLTHIAIKSGVIYYSYSKVLIRAFSRPNVYAQLNLDVQKKFKNKYALILWEFVWGDISPKKSDRTQTGWVTYERLLKIFSLQGSSFENRYALLNKTVLKPAIDEINEKGDVSVCIESKKVGRRVTHVKFVCEKKSSPVNTRVLKAFSSMGINQRVGRDILSRYREDEILSALDFLKKYTQKHTLYNPVAFFMKALENGWVIVEEKPIIFNHNSDEAEDCRVQKIRQELQDIIGEKEYGSWFSYTQLSIEKDVFCVSVSLSFVKTYIENLFENALERVASKNGLSHKVRLLNKD